MRIAKMIKNDVANGNGVRCTIFVSGCRLHCKGCFNKELQDFNCGNEYDLAHDIALVNELSKPYIKGLSILGGEPFEPENVECLTNICYFIKHNQEYANKDIWCWTGHTYESLIKNGQSRELLEQIDVLVDGEFMQELHDPALKFRGSSNQRIIDVKKSLASKQVVLYGED